MRRYVRIRVGVVSRTCLEETLNRARGATIHGEALHRSEIGEPPIGATPATIQSEGGQPSARDRHVVSVRGATRQRKRCVGSGRRMPLASATPTRSPRRGRYSSARPAPALAYKGTTCHRRTRSATSARVATFQCKGCHQSEQDLHRTGAPIARSGAVSQLLSRSPVPDTMRGLRRPAHRSRESRHPADATRCPARIRSVRPRHDQPIPHAQWRGGGAR